MKRVVALAFPLALLGCGRTQEVMMFDPRTGAVVPCSSGIVGTVSPPTAEEQARACADRMRLSGYSGGVPAPVPPQSFAGPAYYPVRPPPPSAVPVGTPVYPLQPIPPGAPGAALNFGAQSASTAQTGPDPLWYEPDGVAAPAEGPGPAVPVSSQSRRRGRPTVLRPDSDQ